MNYLLRGFFAFGFAAILSVGVVADAKPKTCTDILRESTSVRTLPARNLRPGELKAAADNIAHTYEGAILAELDKAQPSADGRTFAKVFENQFMTIWAISWNDKCTDIHDHVGSQVGIRVLRGKIVEEHFKPPQVEPLLTRVLSAGQSVGLGGLPYVHRICGHDGISLHIYSPPLSEMTYYEKSSHGELAPTHRWKDNTP